MASLEKYEFDHFDIPSVSAGEALFMIDANDQGMFDWLVLDKIDDAAVKSIRLAGWAILSSARFSAQVSSSQDGKLTLSYGQKEPNAEFPATDQTEAHNTLQLFA